MAVAKQKAGARNLLSGARELFRSTHWTQGTFKSTSPDLYYEDDQPEVKAVYCAIGGLRQVAGIDPNTVPEEELDELEYLHALEALVEVLALRDDQYGLDARFAIEETGHFLYSGNEYDRQDAIDRYEGVVINWNDGHDTILQDVLSAFKTALTKV